MSYACTFIEKEVEDDSYENGIDPTSRRCLLNERVNIEAESFGELVQKLGDYLGMTIDDLFINEEQEFIEWFGFNRLENADSDEPTEREMDEFRAGKRDLYAADYTFHVEKREVSAIAVDEIRAAGLKTH